MQDVYFRYSNGYKGKISEKFRNLRRKDTNEKKKKYAIQSTEIRLDRTNSNSNTICLTKDDGSDIEKADDQTGNLLLTKAMRRLLDKNIHYSKKDVLDMWEITKKQRISYYQTKNTFYEISDALVYLKESYIDELV